MNMAYLKYALGLLQIVANTGCARLQLQENFVFPTRLFAICGKPRIYFRSLSEILK